MFSSTYSIVKAFGAIALISLTTQITSAQEPAPEDGRLRPVEPQELTPSERYNQIFQIPQEGDLEDIDPAVLEFLLQIMMEESSFSQSDLGMGQGFMLIDPQGLAPQQDFSLPSNKEVRGKILAIAAGLCAENPNDMGGKEDVELVLRAHLVPEMVFAYDDAQMLKDARRLAETDPVAAREFVFRAEREAARMYMETDPVDYFFREGVYDLEGVPRQSFTGETLAHTSPLLFETTPITLKSCNVVPNGGFNTMRDGDAPVRFSFPTNQINTHLERPIANPNREFATEVDYVTASVGRAPPFRIVWSLWEVDRPEMDQRRIQDRPHGEILRRATPGERLIQQNTDTLLALQYTYLGTERLAREGSITPLSIGSVQTRAGVAFAMTLTDEGAEPLGVSHEIRIQERSQIADLDAFRCGSPTPIGDNDIVTIEFKPDPEHTDAVGSWSAIGPDELVAIEAGLDIPERPIGIKVGFNTWEFEGRDLNLLVAQQSQQGYGCTDMIRATLNAAKGVKASINIPIAVFFNDTHAMGEVLYLNDYGRRPSRQRLGSVTVSVERDSRSKY